jgi:hypothetical protein
MKTVTIKVNVSTGYVGSNVEDDVLVYLDEDATEKEIEEAKEVAAREWMFEQIEWGWKDVD